MEKEIEELLTDEVIYKILKKEVIKRIKFVRDNSYDTKFSKEMIENLDKMSSIDINDRIFILDGIYKELIYSSENENDKFPLNYIIREGYKQIFVKRNESINALYLSLKYNDEENVIYRLNTVKINPYEYFAYYYRNEKDVKTYIKKKILEEKFWYEKIKLNYEALNEE